MDLKKNKDVMVRVVKPCTFSDVKQGVKKALAHLGLGNYPPPPEAFKPQDKKETDLLNPDTVEKLVGAILSANGHSKLYCEVAEDDKDMIIYLRK